MTYAISPCGQEIWTWTIVSIGASKARELGDVTFGTSIITANSYCYASCQGTAGSRRYRHANERRLSCKGHNHFLRRQVCERSVCLHDFILGLGA